MLMYLRDGSAQTSVCAATLEIAVADKTIYLTHHSILTPGQPVPVLILEYQAPGKAATGVPTLSHW